MLTSFLIFNLLLSCVLSEYLIFGLNYDHEPIGGSVFGCDFCYQDICYLSDAVFCHDDYDSGCQECEPVKYIAFASVEIISRRNDPSWNMLEIATRNNHKSTENKKRGLTWKMFGITRGMDDNDRMVANSTMIADNYYSIMNNIDYTFLNTNATWVRLLVSC